MKRSLFQRMSTFVLAALLVAIPLSGCGGSSEKASSTAAVTSNNSSVSASTQAEVKTHKLKILGPETGIPNIKFTERDKYLAWQELDKCFKEAGLDIDFEVIPADQYEVTIQTRMASGADLPDFCNISPIDIATCLNLVDKKMIQPINKIIDQYSDGTARDFLKKNDFISKVATAADGNQYWVPNVQEITYNGEPHSTCLTAVIRNDWLQKLGIPVPTNANEFVSALKAFRDKDANGNGVKDEIYVTNDSEFSTGFAEWFGLPNSNIAVDPNTNKVICPWYMDGVKEYFTFMHNLIKEGVLDQTFIGAKGTVGDQAIAENRASGLYTYAMETWLETTITGVKDALYRPLPPLSAVNGITPVCSVEPAKFAFGSFAVTSACKDLEGMGKFLDIIYSDKYATLSAWGVEGKTFVKENNIEKFIIKYGNFDEESKTGIGPGEDLWGLAMFPKSRFAQMETEINGVNPVKGDFQKSIANYSPAIPYDKDAYLAVPTPEEQARLTELKTNFKTYSKELSTDLIIGNKSLKDWDSYIKQMKDIGLDEILKIYQARYDRYMKN